MRLACITCASGTSLCRFRSAVSLIGMLAAPRVLDRTGRCVLEVGAFPLHSRLPSLRNGLVIAANTVVAMGRIRTTPIIVNIAAITSIFDGN